MCPKKTFEIFPEVTTLEKIMRKYLKEKGDLQRIPRMDRLMENYKLLLGKEGEKLIDASIAKELGIAVLFYASGLSAEERQAMLSGFRIGGMGRNAPHEIEFALEDCLRIKKSYAQNSREVELSRNVLASLLSLLVHMDELGEEDMGLLAVIETSNFRKQSLDLYGNIPSDQLRDMINYKILRDSTENLLRQDGSIVATAILHILKTRYYIAPIAGYLNTEILMEIRTRRMWLRTETERLIRMKMKNEKSIEL